MKNERLSKPHWVRFRYGLAALVVLAVTTLNFYIQMADRVIGNDQCRWIDIAPSRMEVTDIVAGGTADRAGLKDGDVILAINGKEFKSATGAQMLINAVAGKQATYLVKRHGATFEATVLILKSVNLQYLASYVYGLGFLIVGLVVVLMKPLGSLQRAFAKYSILTMLFFGLTALNVNPAYDSPWKVWLLATSFVVATVAAMPVFVRFFLLFPVHRPSYDWRWLRITLLVVSAVMGALFVASVKVVAIRSFTNTLANLRFAFVLAGPAIFVHSYFWRVRPERRRELRPILLGSAIAMATFLYALLMPPFAAFINPTLALPAMLAIVVPVLFGYAIFRYGLMDIDLLVQRTLTYGAVTTSMAAIYLMLVYGVGSLLTYLFGAGDDRLMHITALVAIAIAFEPLKSRLQQHVDRIFYRERYDYQQALRELMEELPQLLDVRQILDALLQRISSTMHIERMAVIVCDDLEGCTSVGRNVADEDLVFGAAEHTLQALLKKTRKPMDVHLLTEGLEVYDLGEEELRKLQHAGVVLSVPMLLKERLIGFINVGSKMSGRGYAQEDVNLLATVAAQAAIAIENARLHRSELEKERIREELTLARQIQKGLLPKENPSFPGLDLAGISIPATSVGGDYFDFIQAAPDSMLVVVADVSGKGMSAALYMSKIQGMVQLAAHMYRSPKEMLIHINRRIFEGMDRRSFITMVLAQFDMKNREVRVCRAGHTKALVRDGGRFRLLEGTGIALGLERGPVFEEQIEEVRFPLESDGLFVFYTDGITETMNDTEEQYGEDRIVRILERSRSLPAIQIQQAILDDAAAFRGHAEQYDDVTLTVVKCA